MSTQLTEDQIASNLKAYERAMRDGHMRNIQVDVGVWDSPSGSFSTILCYRVKPEPKLRPWKAEEVPLNAWFRDKTDPKPVWSPITCRWEGSGYVYFDLIADKQLHCARLFQCFEYSTDNGRTWSPCGVLEG